MGIFASCHSLASALPQEHGTIAIALSGSCQIIVHKKFAQNIPYG